MTPEDVATNDAVDQVDEEESDEAVPSDPDKTTVMIISDFVCPWCYIGAKEIERLSEEYNLEVRFAPYLLDPSTPIEGKPARYRTAPDAPPTPIEQRAVPLGISYTRGREWTSNSLLAHEASEHITEHETPEIAWAFHEAMFKAYFTDLNDIAQTDLLLKVAGNAGANVESLREALTDRRYQQQVHDALNWAKQIGVSGVPTFIFDDQYGIVGAQELGVLQNVMEQLGKRRKSLVASSGC